MGLLKKIGKAAGHIVAAPLGVLGSAATATASVVGGAASVVNIAGRVVPLHHGKRSTVSYEAPSPTNVDVAWEDVEASMRVLESVATQSPQPVPAADVVAYVRGAIPDLTAEVADALARNVSVSADGIAKYEVIFALTLDQAELTVEHIVVERTTSSGAASAYTVRILACHVRATFAPMCQVPGGALRPRGFTMDEGKILIAKLGEFAFKQRPSA